MTTITCKFTPAPKPAPGRKVKQPLRPRRVNPVRVARMLALAHHVEEQIEAGAVPDYAAAAAALGVTRARLSQVMALLLLAPEIQERIAMGEIAVSERDLRAVVGEPLWAVQTTLLAAIRPVHLSSTGRGALATANISVPNGGAETFISQPRKGTQQHGL